jgi:NET1-associated nuclear protein 1 (U3 small nucleolar RNA-associated protein 17)
MAPTRDRNAEADRATKRKRDKAEAEEERRNRKKQKSKPKSLPDQNGQQDNEAGSTTQQSRSQPTDELSNLQLVRQGDSNGQVQATRSAAPWHVSKPIGGRMLDIDPVFSLDEV